MDTNKKYYGNAILKREDVPFKSEIKLDYYKTEENNNFGIEIVKTETNDEIEINEKIKLQNITSDESIIENILNKIHEYKVTPITVSDVIADYMCTLS